MNTIRNMVLFTVVAAILSACGSPAANTSPSNTNTSNTNTTKPTASAPTVDTFLPMEKAALEAYLKGDGKYFEGILSDKFAMVNAGHRFDKAETVKMISGVKCEAKDGWRLEDPQLVMVDADTYVFSYKNNVEGSCTANGQTEKMDKPMRVATVWAKSGDKWSVVFHGENAIVDPKAPPPAKPETEKPEEKKSADSNTAPVAPAAPGPAKSANTDALVAAEKSGWEAWKLKDAKKLDEFAGKSISILGSDGVFMTNKAEIIKYWVEMPCKDIKTVDVKDGFGISISPTVEMLTFIGTADGTCYDQKNGSSDSMSIYVKDGNAWKFAFGFSGATM